MTDKQKAWAEMLAWTFLGGVAGDLAPHIVGGTLPPENTWKSIAACAIAAGVVAVRNRLMPAPSQVKS